jgi:hypothetical protein
LSLNVRCAHALFLRDGGCHRGGAGSRRELHIGPAHLAAAASPALAGALFAASFRAWPLLICGALKIAYDLLLLMQFRHLKPPEER